MTIKTALITGGNKGIGFETARQLAGSGYRIWLGCRDRGRGQTAVEQLLDQGHDVRLLISDVTSDESVRAAAEQVQDEDGRLDVLINNAGIPGSTPSAGRLQSVEDIRTVYETNVFGAIRMTQAFVPLLTVSGQGNVVMISSGLGSLGWLSDPDNQFYGVNVLGYNSSKSALNAVTVSLAKSLAPANIKVNSADPGYTATDFNGHSGYRTVEQAAAGIVWLARQDASGPTGGFFFEQECVPW